MEKNANGPLCCSVSPERHLDICALAVEVRLPKRPLAGLALSINYIGISITYRFMVIFSSGRQ